jgi:hypothetical protein
MLYPLPPIREMFTLCRSVKLDILDIDDDCRAFEDDEEPGILLTVGWEPQTGGWAFQTGDNSFSGAAYSYPVWAVVGVYSRSNCRELAREILSQLGEAEYNDYHRC